MDSGSHAEAHAPTTTKERRAYILVGAQRAGLWDIGMKPLHVEWPHWRKPKEVKQKFPPRARHVARLTAYHGGDGRLLSRGDY